MSFSQAPTESETVRWKRQIEEGKTEVGLVEWAEQDRADRTSRYEIKVFRKDGEVERVSSYASLLNHHAGLSSADDVYALVFEAMAFADEVAAYREVVRQQQYDYNLDKEQRIKQLEDQVKLLTTKG